ncbi:ribonuclease HI family protein [Deinococcus pimensis]|uniref:ribonuclease HI family protein n=1 Tax=Deinococcus pimensis TaxID=309888 RepID=UPI0004AD8A7B|nr:ribonuclease HI family protein [Deinococcus pimensis]
MYYAHTDGGSRGNPGPAGYGWMLLRNDSLIAYEHGYMGADSTNNQAEYQGVLRLFEYLNEHYRGSPIEIRCDSQLVVKQLEGDFRVKDAAMFALHQRVQALMAEYGREHITFRWVRRNHNRCADLLVNVAIDELKEPTISENNKNQFAFRLKGLYTFYDKPGLLAAAH